MRLGDVTNKEAVAHGKPLTGLRVLAIEQLQALPYATQLLARLGADVVKVEPPKRGDSGRSSRPAITEPDGSKVGATFLRNNLGKKSVTLDLRHPTGRELLLALVPYFDIVAQNHKAGSLASLGLGYEDVAAMHPGCIYVSLSGFGNDGRSPYRFWQGVVPVVEAMSGIYEIRGARNARPLVAPMGAAVDVGSALTATVGILAAVLHRQRTGEGQHVDIAMMDVALAMTDIVTNMWSLGVEDIGAGTFIVDAFRANDGWFVLQVTRAEHFAILARTVEHPDWITDPRFASGQGWVDSLEEVIRPAVEQWAVTRTKAEAAASLTDAGLAAAPCLKPGEVAADPHVASRNMLVEIPRMDGDDRIVLTPGNPVKLSKVAEGPESRFPAPGQDNVSVFGELLGITAHKVEELAADGVI